MCGEVNFNILKTFRTIEISAGLLPFDAVNKYFANKKVTADADFTLVLSNIKNGGDYNLVVLKNTASDVVINLPVSSKVSGSTDTTITLNGASGINFWIGITNDGINNLFTVNGSSSSSGGLVVEEMLIGRVLTLADNGKHFNCNSVLGFTITIPPGLPKSPNAFNFVITQTGAGQITLAGEVGVTLIEPDVQFKTAKQNATVGVINSTIGIGAETYTLSGYTAL